MKNHVFKRITAVTLILIVLCSIFCSTILAAENDTQSVSNECCTEEITQALTKSPYSLSKNQKVTLTDTKADLIAAIKSPDVFSVNGTVTEGNATRTINESFDFTYASKFDAADWACEAGLISEEEKIDCYCDIIINRHFVNETCLNPAFEVIEAYKSSKRIPAELETKIQAASANPFTEEAEDGEKNESRSIPILQQKTYESTNFKIFYAKNSTSESSAANIANYLEQIRTTFRNMGFNYPINEKNWLNQPIKYKVYLDPEAAPDDDPNDTSRIAGRCKQVTENSKTSASYITLFNFTSFTDNSTSANINLKEVMAHEYFHAIQNSYNTFYNWFKEACANWALIIVTGTTNHVLTPINSFITSGLSLINENYEYGAVLFPLTIHKLCGGSSAILSIYQTLNSSSSYSFTDAEFHTKINTGLSNNYSDETVVSLYRKMTGFVYDTSYWYSSITSDILSTDIPPFVGRLDITSNTSFSYQSYTIDPYRSEFYLINQPSGYNGRVKIEVTFYSPNGYLQVYRTTNRTLYFPESTYMGNGTYKATYTLESYQLMEPIIFSISNTSTTGAMTYDVTVSPIN